MEKARSEEALARLALEELIAHYSDALPYAIVPNGNGRTNAGTPAGNNPSGSALGPAASTHQASGSFRINDWTHYLSQAFGSGIHPAYAGEVNTAYPFTASTNGYTGLRTENGVCGGNGPIRSATGTIESVGNGSFQLRQADGSLMQVNISPCTQTTSNQANYHMTAGNIAVVKGVQRGSNMVQAQNIMCLA